MWWWAVGRSEGRRLRGSSSFAGLAADGGKTGRGPSETRRRRTGTDDTGGRGWGRGRTRGRDKTVGEWRDKTALPTRSSSGVSHCVGWGCQWTTSLGAGSTAHRLVVMEATMVAAMDRGRPRQPHLTRPASTPRRRPRRGGAQGRRSGAQAATAGGQSGKYGKLMARMEKDEEAASNAEESDETGLRGATAGGPRCLY